MDIDEAIVKRSLSNIENLLNKRVQKGKMTNDEVKALLGRIVPSTDVKDAADADFVIEAVIENVQLKQKIFAQLEEVVRKDAILATNTTACAISEIASALKEPSRLVGMHFFNPAVVMKLVEIMPGVASDPRWRKSVNSPCFWARPVVTAKEGVGIASRVLAGL